MNIIIYLLIILVVSYILLRLIASASAKKISKTVRLVIFIISIFLALLFAFGGRFSFNKSNSNISTLSVEEAYKVLNLDRNNKITKEDVQKAYLKIQKKIHPDVSPETSRLSTIVNEAKEVVLKDLS